MPDLPGRPAQPEFPRLLTVYHADGDELVATDVPEDGINSPYAKGDRFTIAEYRLVKVRHVKAVTVLEDVTEYVPDPQ